MVREAWWVIVHGVAELDTNQQQQQQQPNSVLVKSRAQGAPLLGSLAMVLNLIPKMEILLIPALQGSEG